MCTHVHGRAPVDQWHQLIPVHPINDQSIVTSILFDHPPALARAGLFSEVGNWWALNLVSTFGRLWVHMYVMHPSSPVVFSSGRRESKRVSSKPVRYVSPIPAACLTLSRSRDHQAASEYKSQKPRLSIKLGGRIPAVHRKVEPSPKTPSGGKVGRGPSAPRSRTRRGIALPELVLTSKLYPTGGVLSSPLPSTTSGQPHPANEGAKMIMVPPLRVVCDLDERGCPVPLQCSHPQFKDKRSVSPGILRPGAQKHTRRDLGCLTLLLLFLTSATSTVRLASSPRSSDRPTPVIQRAESAPVLLYRATSGGNRVEDTSDSRCAVAKLLSMFATWSQVRPTRAVSPGSFDFSTDMKSVTTHMKSQRCVERSGAMRRGLRYGFACIFLSHRVTVPDPPDRVSPLSGSLSCLPFGSFRARSSDARTLVGAEITKGARGLYPVNFSAGHSAVAPSFSLTIVSYHGCPLCPYRPRRRKSGASVGVWMEVTPAQLPEVKKKYSSRSGPTVGAW